MSSLIHLLDYGSEKAMAPHSSTVAWKIPWTEEPGRLQSMRSLRVGHDFTFTFTFSLSCIGEGNGNPLQCSCLENPRDGGAWWVDVYGVAQSRTRLKQFSSSRLQVPYRQTLCLSLWYHKQWSLNTEVILKTRKRIEKIRDPFRDFSSM